MPAEAAAQPESTTPTGLAMIALAVIDGELPFDDGTRAALARLSGARSCVAACPYGYDIASLIAGYAQQWSAADPAADAP